MASFATVLRAAVMLAMAVVLVKGWALYGPSTQQMKSWTAAIVERAHLALSERPQLAPANGLASQNKGPDTLSGAMTASHGRFEETEFPAVPRIPSDAAPKAGAASNESSQFLHDDSVEFAQMHALIARLERLGAVDPQLAAWGSSGNLYRFCCRAALGDSPTYTRHFESVAVEPLEAVEAVLSKVESWRSELRRQVEPR
jgi:hypothetical protein